MAEQCGDTPEHGSHDFGDIVEVPVEERVARQSCVEYKWRVLIDDITYLARPHQPLASNSEVRSSPSFVVYLASINAGGFPQIFNLPPLKRNSCLCLFMNKASNKQYFR
jgi:hypothetical protein